MKLILGIIAYNQSKEAGHPSTMAEVGIVSSNIALIKAALQILFA